jgi:hypothetical protein
MAQQVALAEHDALAFQHCGIGLVVPEHGGRKQPFEGRRHRKALSHAIADAPTAARVDGARQAVRRHDRRPI